MCLLRSQLHSSAQGNPALDADPLLPSCPYSDALGGSARAVQRLSIAVAILGIIEGV